MEEIQKIVYEPQPKNESRSESSENQKEKEKEKNVKPKYPKSKKKNKKVTKIIIDEELKKSTPIRNLKKQPKGILKKTSLTTHLFNLNSPPPKSQIRSKSSDKKVTLSSESKDKKFKTFSEIFQSPSKLKATPLKRKINSEKKSSHKKSNILFIEDSPEKKIDFIGKKRNISFNDERIVKEYNPKTPVRDVKQRMIRKSPLERKKKKIIN